jgi:enoyl-CoA hydratase/carnithine racemase
MAYEMIEVRTEAGKVGIVTLNRPKQLNALNDGLMDELGAALKAFDADAGIGCHRLSPAATRPLPPGPTSACWPSTTSSAPTPAT